VFFAFFVAVLSFSDQFPVWNAGFVENRTYAAKTQFSRRTRSPALRAQNKLLAAQLFAVQQPAGAFSHPLHDNF